MARRASDPMPLTGLTSPRIYALLDLSPGLVTAKRPAISRQ